MIIDYLQCPSVRNICVIYKLHITTHTSHKTAPTNGVLTLLVRQAYIPVNVGLGPSRKGCVYQGQYKCIYLLAMVYTSMVQAYNNFIENVMLQAST